MTKHRVARATTVTTTESSDNAPVALNSTGNGVSTSVVVLTDPKVSAKTGLTIKKNLSALTIDKQGDVLVMRKDFDTLKNKNLLTKVYAFDESSPKA